MQPAISVNNLSKVYRRGRTPGELVGGDLRETLARLIRNPFRQLFHAVAHGRNSQEFWALRDVSFEVQPGEILGVVGRNGAGKSTLLKILSQITEPTHGRAEIRGRVGSLLEVGTGFHPELTGRENVFLNGAILGMTRAEIHRQFDEIVDFSGVEQFIDTPVKRYSSGMRVRLGFAVAAYLDPEVLIVDEVLAVGDADFQKRCLGKMRGVAASGRTVLFVSHNMQAVSTLTDRCLLLSEGACLAQGSPTEVIHAYLSQMGSTSAVYTANGRPDQPCVTRVELKTSEPGNVHRHGQPLELRFEITAPEPIDGASLSFQVTDEYGRPVLHLWTFDSERPWCREPGVFHATCLIPKCRLYMGSYTLTVHFTEKPGGKRFDRLDGICPFEVVMHSINREFKWEAGTSTYLDDCDWQVCKQNGHPENSRLESSIPVRP